MKKLTVLVAGAAGYVLGARAGRQRYEQIASGARKRDGQPEGAVRQAAGPGRRGRAGRARRARRPRRPPPTSPPPPPTRSAATAARTPRPTSGRVGAASGS